MKIEEFYEGRAQAKNPQDEIKCLEDDRWAKVKRSVNRCGRGLKILDAGCGNGWQTSFFLEGNEVSGLDIAASNVQQACQRGILARRHDIETPWPYPDGTFDLVVCSEVLEHVFFPEKIIREITRVLKPRGQVIISTPNLYSLGNRLALLYGKKCALIEYPYNQEHIRHYSFGGLKKILKEAGFKVKDLSGASYTMNLLDLNLISMILIGLPYLLLGLPFLLFSLVWHFIRFDFSAGKIVLTGNFWYQKLLGDLLPVFSPGLIITAGKNDQVTVLPIVTTKTTDYHTA